MALNAVLDSLDGIDAALHEHYTEKDGKFFLDLSDFGQHPGAQTLKRTLDKVNKDKATAEAKVADLEAKVASLPEDFDPDEYVRLKAAKGDKPDEALDAIKAQHARAIEAIKARHAQELADKDKLIGERDGYIDNTLVDGGLRDALIETGVKPDLLDGALAVLRGGVKVQRGEDGTRRAIVETDLGEVDVPAFVAEWAKSKGKAYLGTASGPDPRGNNGARAGSKTMARAEFDKLAPEQQMKVMTVDKITVV